MCATSGHRDSSADMSKIPLTKKQRTRIKNLRWEAAEYSRRLQNQSAAKADGQRRAAYGK